MTFISYAQNFEDIILWRALKHVRNGFYIDVGANDPDTDSVTLAFYQRGWHGINVEPMRQYYEQLCVKRPADINLRVALGEAAGELTFYDVADTGLSTADADIGQRHIDAGHRVSQERVPVMTLSEVCAAHARDPIHFLKIDVEGFEKAVLLGMDFRRWRPWVLVIEATMPQSHVTSHEEWEHIVRDAGYVSAYFDGLNQFYVAEEHQELLPAFKAPPNYFDHFQLRKHHAFSFPIHALEQQLSETAAAVQEMQARASHAEQHARQLQSSLDKALAERNSEIEQALAQSRQALSQCEQALHQSHSAHEEVRARLLHALHEIDSLRSSTSWRITRPIRQFKNAANNPGLVAVKAKSLFNRVKAPARRVVFKVLRKVAAHPRIRSFAIRSLRRFPSLEAWARKVATGLASRPAAETYTMPAADTATAANDLSLSAQRVFADVQRAVHKSK